MDIKASKGHYAEATGIQGLDISLIEKSVTLLMEQDRIPYEFRTTVVKGLHTPEQFDEIGKWLAGAYAYYLQNYRESDTILDPSGNFSSFTREELEDMAQRARKYIAKVEIRGVY